MTGSEVVTSLLNVATVQIKGIFKDLPAELINSKLHEGLMSPATTAAHLCEVYTSVLTASKGEVHKWGTYELPVAEWTNVLELMWSLRAEAIAVVPSLPEDKGAHLAIDYIAAHDFYHVGQLAALRVALEPNWNAYSIYGE